jgi:hypothetical protein
VSSQSGCETLRNPGKTKHIDTFYTPKPCLIVSSEFLQFSKRFVRFLLFFPPSHLISDRDTRTIHSFPSASCVCRKIGTVPSYHHFLDRNNHFGVQIHHSPANPSRLNR